MPQPHDATIELRSADQVTEVVASIESRLREVRATYARQVQAETDLATERARITQARDELSDRQRRLEQMRQELAQRGEEVERTGFEAERRRAALVRLEEDVQRRTAEVAAQERQAKAKADELQAELARLDALRTQVEQDRRDIMQRALDLEKREAELTRRAAKAPTKEDDAKRKKDLERAEAERKALQSKLRDIEGVAAQAQRDAEAKVRDAERRAQAALEQAEHEAKLRESDLAARLKEQESITRTLRDQLAGAMRKVRSPWQQEADHAESRVPIRQRLDSMPARRAAIWMTWLTIITFVIVGTGTLLSKGDPLTAYAFFGLAFGAAFFGAHAVARRLLYPPAIAIGAIVTTSGFWFPVWAGACRTAFATWDLPLDALPAGMVGQAPLAFAALFAGVVLAIGTLSCTGSLGVFAYFLVASIVAAAMLLFPDSSGALPLGAALLWLILVAASLSQWAMRLIEQSGGAAATTPARV